MLDFIWSFAIIAGTVTCFITHGPQEAAGAITDGAASAVELCIFMAGTMSFWSGIMNIAQESGLIDNLSRKIRPVMRFLFPDVPPESAAFKYICVNMADNFMGLGWAATPAGLMAMSELKKIHNVTNTASRAMCMLIAVNVSSVQLLPINIIIMRQKYLSAAPFDIVFPSIVATSISTFAAVAAVKICERRYFK